MHGEWKENAMYFPGRDGGPRDLENMFFREGEMKSRRSTNCWRMDFLWLLGIWRSLFQWARPNGRVFFDDYFCDSIFFSWYFILFPFFNCLIVSFTSLCTLFSFFMLFFVTLAVRSFFFQIDMLIKKKCWSMFVEWSFLPKQS